MEKLASDVLNQYLGQYVENVSTDKLNIQIWKGMHMAGIPWDPLALVSICLYLGFVLHDD